MIKKFLLLLHLEESNQKSIIQIVSYGDFIGHGNCKSKVTSKLYFGE